MARATSVDMTKPTDYRAPNYRVIIISVIDGTLYDVAEFVNLADADAHAIAAKSTRWDLHPVYVGLDGANVYIMGRQVS
jgi:hypothetical protein